MNFEKKNYIYKMVMLVTITVLITFLITAIGMYNFFIKTENGLVKTMVTTETTKLDTKIQLIRTYLDKFYLGEIEDEEALIESAVKGYVDGIGDEYTEYLTKEEYEELMVDVNGNYVGIGVYMVQDRYDNIVILLPIKDSPAEKAGLKSGDIITKVNGEDCTGMDLRLVSNMVKGEEGTTVDLEILRENEIINKTIERKKIKINHINSEILENNIGYIQILAFDSGCSEEFETKLKELLDKNIKSLIIDLRYNGGGIVTEAINISELFLPKDKKIMIQVDKTGKEEVINSKEEPVVNSNLDIIVLANENSASASEIFIGALKDNNIAKVVGTKTYGKGVMQEVTPLQSGGALKLTIEEFLTPNGDKINKKGIEPDIEVKENEDTEVDEQLQKAIETLK